jgi:pimeloyl-ACP methyl ester carboxylesterase
MKLCDLAIEEKGQGPSVVFIHGFALDRRMWYPQIKYFSTVFHCVTYDLRGFGESPVPFGSYNHTDDLLNVLKTLKLDRIHLVGLSLGANIALSFAAQNADRVISLTLASSGLAGHDWGKEERPPTATDCVARHQGVEAARTFWLEHPLFASLENNPSAKAEVFREVLDYSGWHWQKDGRQARMTPTGPLEKVVVPTLVISGKQDLKGYRNISRKIAATLPNAKFQQIQNAGHMCNLEDANAFNTALSGILHTKGDEIL